MEIGDYKQYQPGDTIPLDDDDLREIEENEKQGSMLYSQYKDWSQTCIKYIGKSMLEFGNAFVDDPKTLHNMNEAARQVVHRIVTMRTWNFLNEKYTGILAYDCVIDRAEKEIIIKNPLQKRS